MKNLKLSELKVQITGLSARAGSVSVLKSAIKQAESEYTEYLPYQGIGVERLILPFSNSDIKHLKHILVVLEKPSEFEIDQDYLISTLINPVSLSKFLQKFSIEESNIDLVVNDISALIKEHQHGM